MFEANRYEVAPALIKLARNPQATREEAAHIVASLTDVPDDRIGAMLDEMTDSEQGKVMMAAMRLMATMMEDADMARMLPTALWVDDDKGTLNIVARNESGAVVAKVHHNGKTGAMDVNIPGKE